MADALDHVDGYDVTLDLVDLPPLLDILAAADSRLKRPRTAPLSPTRPAKTIEKTSVVWVWMSRLGKHL